MISRVNRVGRVDIRPLKGFVIQNMGKGSVLREVILQEPEELSIEEFVAKMGTWLALHRLESIGSARDRT